MMKPVRNSARAIITPFEGAVLVPIAVLRGESTTAVRVKDVTITRIDGAMDRMVMRATSCRARSVTPVPSGSVSVTDCADADDDSKPNPTAATRRAADLQEVTAWRSRGCARAGSPSPPRDWQTDPEDRPVSPAAEALGRAAGAQPRAPAPGPLHRRHGAREPPGTIPAARNGTSAPESRGGAGP